MTVGRVYRTVRLTRATAGVSYGSLPQDGDSFMIGGASYTIKDIFTVVRTDGDRRRLSLELVDSRRFTPAVKEALRVHWCSDSSGLTDPTPVVTGLPIPTKPTGRSTHTGACAQPAGKQRRHGDAGHHGESPARPDPDGRNGKRR